MTHPSHDSALPPQLFILIDDIPIRDRIRDRPYSDHPKDLGEDPDGFSVGVGTFRSGFVEVHRAGVEGG
jgi:diadenosine tetraphosphatase ApaH/serine/threonine PP2A family protein phosphatase